jgi:RHS repeat-associated protein
VAGNPQLQDFEYDDLNRLETAEVTGGTGGTYSEKSYTYNSSTGNLASKEGVNYTYGDSNHPHAVTSLSNGWSYSYDANGNQTARGDGGTDFTLTYDIENRLEGVSGDASASFVYDGDGNRVKGTVEGVTIIYVGDHYEVEIGSPDTIRKYYYARGARIAMREDSTLYWLLTDHLGSTALTIDANGELKSEKRYMPWGETRFESGSTYTSYQYTGQQLEEDLGIYYYNARWYDPALGRFIQADTIVPNPGNPQSVDRYAYVNNNPMRYNDPSGNCIPDYNCPGDPPIEDPIIWIILPTPEDPTYIQWYGYTNLSYNRWEEDKKNKYCDYAQCLHAGIDLGAPGGTEIFAGVSGTIVGLTNTKYEPGKITIKLDNSLYLIYGHVGEWEVEVGDTVEPETVLGKIGNKIDHVHLEVWIPGEEGLKDPSKGTMINPLPFFRQEHQALLAGVAYKQPGKTYPANSTEMVSFYKTPDGVKHTRYDDIVIQRSGDPLY